MSEGDEHEDADADLNASAKHETSAHVLLDDGSMQDCDVCEHADTDAYQDQTGAMAGGDGDFGRMHTQARDDSSASAQASCPKVSTNSRDGSCNEHVTAEKTDFQASNRLFSAAESPRFSHREVLHCTPLKPLFRSPCHASADQRADSDGVGDFWPARRSPQLAHASPAAWGHCSESSPCTGPSQPHSGLEDDKIHEYLIAQANAPGYPNDPEIMSCSNNSQSSGQFSAKLCRMRDGTEGDAQGLSVCLSGFFSFPYRHARLLMCAECFLLSESQSPEAFRRMKHAHLYA